MIKIAIVDDDKTVSEVLEKFILTFGNEKNTLFDIQSYTDAVDFLNGYKCDRDIIFLDIEMPHIDGIRTAKKIRERDENVILVFVTNFSQYAIKGYEVRAFDYILKPVRYTNLVMTLERIVNVLEHGRNDVYINLQLKDGVARISVSDILYIEVANHDVFIHTLQADDYKVRGTISSYAGQLKDKHFVLCNSCYLVNLKYVKRIDKESVYVGDDVLHISHNKRKDFLREAAKYFGGSV